MFLLSMTQIQAPKAALDFTAVEQVAISLYKDSLPFIKAAPIRFQRLSWEKANT